MAPLTDSLLIARRMKEVTKPTDPVALIVEAWAQGFMVGAILIMLCITISNTRRGVLLHKLILLELIFGMFHGTFIFLDAPVYGWYLSVTAVFLIISWNLHNLISWIKIRPFITRKTSIIFLTTLALAQPYWVLEMYADFAYFNNINDIYLKTRVFEALFRDPWWVYTTCCLVYNVRTRYSFGLFELMRFSPRFAVMLVAMVLSIIFTIIDICAVMNTLSAAIPIGINPFWKLAFVFKLLTDSVILDDFKTALDKLSQRNLARVEGRSGGNWTHLQNHSSNRDGAIRISKVPPSMETKVSWSVVEDAGLENHGIAVTTETTMERHIVDGNAFPQPSKCLCK